MIYQLEHLKSTTFLKKESGRNFCFPLHLHQSFELILLDAGEMTLTINNYSYLMKRGDAAFIFPNQIHSLKSVSSKHTLFIFSPEIIPAYWREKNMLIPTNNIFNMSAQLFKILHSLSQKSSKYEVKGAMYMACASFDTQTKYQMISPEKNNFLTKILLYVEENFTDDCSTKTVARKIGYNPSYIFRVFKEKIGISFSEYLNIRRLSYAAYLLTNTEESIIECAMKSGYSTLRSFNRNFKEQFHITPHVFRMLYSVNIEEEYK